MITEVQRAALSQALSALNAEGLTAAHLRAYEFQLECDHRASFINDSDDLDPADLPATGEGIALSILDDDSDWYHNEGGAIADAWKTVYGTEG